MNTQRQKQKLDNLITIYEACLKFNSCDRRCPGLKSTLCPGSRDRARMLLPVLIEYRELKYKGEPNVLDVSDVEDIISERYKRSIDGKGRICTPKRFAKKLRLSDGDILYVTLEDDRIIMRKMEA